MSIYRYLLLLLISTIFITCGEQRGKIESMMRESGKFDYVLDNAEKHKVQIIYTQIDRDKENKPIFTTHTYRTDQGEYFYPASSIKLPVAVMAIEKVNDEMLRGFTPFSTMMIDSAFSGQTSVYKDTSSHTGYPSLGHYIKKLFLVSDNDSYNRLYEFLGQRDANVRMYQKGMEDVRITHRLSIPLSIEENQHTNPMRFYYGDTLVYEQEALHNEVVIKSDTPIYIGKGYMKGGQLINEPMDFTHKNAISLTSLHRTLQLVMFPEHFYPAERFALNKIDYQFLYQFMSKYPQESSFPYYGGRYEDDYCKFLMFAGTNGNIDRNIRIYNKIGMAYGFLIDIAYIIDLEKKIEFMLGAVIYVNENEILSDDQYEYESIGFPFMRDLGQLFYEYEVERPRANVPDLSKYNWKLWVE